MARKEAVRADRVLDGLTAGQRSELSRLAASGDPARTMPHEIAVLLGVSRPQALAILGVLEHQHLCTMELLIYHECDPEVPVGTVPFGAGFPALPWRCPQCEADVRDRAELSYDFQATFPVSVVFK